MCSMACCTTYAPEPGLIYITVNPDDPVFHNNHGASLERMFAHELHHAVRWAGPGYGSSLGEALISEELAGHFSIQVCGGTPEPWECLNRNQMIPHVQRALHEWNRTDYNHNTWFFGTGELPGWLGYSLGFELVYRYLSDHREKSASTLGNTDASIFMGLLLTDRE